MSTAGAPRTEPSQPWAPATVGSRVVAYLIDRICIVAVGVGFGGIATAIAATRVPTPSSTDRSLWAICTLVGVGVMVASLGVGLLAGSDGSPGMMLMGIRLVRDGSTTPAGFLRVLWRGVLFVLAAVTVVGFVSPLLDRNRRRGWHDRLSGTGLVSAHGGRGAALEAPRAYAVLTSAGARWEFRSSILLGRDPMPSGEERVEVIGRLGPGERSVSRTHALLTVQPAGLVVEDRGSANGTAMVVGGALRDVAERPIVLPPGATLLLGHLELTIEEPR